MSESSAVRHTCRHQDQSEEHCREIIPGGTKESSASWQNFLCDINEPDRLAYTKRPLKLHHNAAAWVGRAFRCPPPTVARARRFGSSKSLGRLVLKKAFIGDKAAQAGREPSVLSDKFAT